MAAVERDVLIADAEKRKASLEKRAHALDADLSALLGAIQDCEFWIAWFKGEIKPEIKPEDEVQGQIVGIEEIPETAATEE
jgi:hypothetical protein